MPRIVDVQTQRAKKNGFDRAFEYTSVFCMCSLSTAVITSCMFHFQPSSEINNQKISVYGCVSALWMCGSLEHHTKTNCFMFVHLRNVSASLYSISITIAFTQCIRSARKIKLLIAFGEKKRSSTTKIQVPSTVCNFFLLLLFCCCSVCFTLDECVCKMFIRSHVSDDYLLKELTIPCNLPGKCSLFVHHSVSSSEKTKPSTNQIHSQMKRNETKAKIEMRTAEQRVRWKRRCCSASDRFFRISRQEKRSIHHQWISPLQFNI